MKRRTREENAAYSRMLRLRKRGVAPDVLAVAPVPFTVAPVMKVAPQGVAPVAPCRGCLERDVQLKIVRAKLLLAEKELDLLRKDRPSKELDKGEGGKKESPYKFGPDWQRRTEPLHRLS